MIDHLEHAWMPSADGWRETSDVAISMIGAVLDALHGRTRNDSYDITLKIDDAMSMKVRKLNGTVAVGYKGKTSPFVPHGVPVQTYYGNKPYVDKLENVLNLLPELLHEYDNVQFQVGFMAYDPNGFITRVVPNIIPYEILAPETSILCLNLVSCYDIDDEGFILRKRSTELNSTRRVAIVDNSVKKQSDDIMQYANTYGVLARVWNDRMTAYAHGVWDIKIDHPKMKRFLNGWFRENDTAPSYIDYMKFLGYPEGHMSFETSLKYDCLFSLVYSMWVACAMVTTIGDVVEGYVVSDGTRTMKIIDPTFTRENHKKWNTLKAE